jgi:hypothetical protein
VILTTALTVGRLTLLQTAIEAGAGAPALEVWAGEVPADAETTPAGALLVACPLARPIGTVANGALTLAEIPEAMVTTTGNASFARFVDGDGVPVALLTLGGTGSAAEVLLPFPEGEPLRLYAGAYLRPTAGVLTE